MILFRLFGTQATSVLRPPFFCSVSEGDMLSATNLSNMNMFNHGMRLAGQLSEDEYRALKTRLLSPGE